MFSQIKHSFYLDYMDRFVIFADNLHDLLLSLLNYKLYEWVACIRNGNF